MITHEEARKQTKFIHQTHRQELIINYITQQEKKEKRAKKVEELLQAYRELIDNTSAWELDWDGHAKIEILEEEINLKEKESEELK